MIRLTRGTRTAVLPPMWSASASVAKNVIQSPHEEAALAHQSLAKAPLRNSSMVVLYVVSHHPGTLVAGGLRQFRRADRPLSTGPF